MFILRTQLCDPHFFQKHGHFHWNQNKVSGNDNTFKRNDCIFETFVLQFAVQKCLYLGGFWSDFEFLKTHMSPHVSCYVLGMSWAYPGHVLGMSWACSSHVRGTQQLTFDEFFSIFFNFFFQFFSICLLKINFFM